ncbi:MAG TPA: ABC transporter permease [Gemmatimonadaceae bacterium]|nr:ABC transporter permease [Gemmatimonadaceae bacterium]
MARLGGWLARWRGRDEQVDELDEEFQFHLDMHTEKNRRLGMTTAEARRRALVAFGGRARYHDEVRDERAGRWLESLVRDLRLAARGLRRAPGFTLVAVLSLAVGIGANTAVFSVVNAVLLRPPPYPGAEQIVVVGLSNADGPALSGLSTADAVALATLPAFAEFGVISQALAGMTVTSAGEARQVAASSLTSGAFRALGVAPQLGRLFLASEDRPGTAPVVVLSDAYWRSSYGASPDVLGRTIVLDGVGHTVVGVMPPGFRIPGLPADDVWPVLQLEPPDYRAPFWLRGIGRLKAGTTEPHLRAELGALASAVKRQYPDSPPQWSYATMPLQEWLVQDTRPTLLALYGAVALVLLMAAANVANLLLARATTRAPEIAVRTALGAGRRRLVQQLLAESVLVAGIGGVLGLLLALVGVRVLLALLPGGLVLPAPVRIDGAVLLFTAGVAVVTGLVVGLVPALSAPEPLLAASLREGGRGGSEGRRRRRLRGGLVVAQFALALTVLVGAALLVRSLQRLQQVDAGVARDGVLVASVALPERRYAEEARIERFWDEVLARVSRLPGVTAASVSMSVPPDRLRMRNPYTPEGTAPSPGAAPPVAEELLVGADYFRTLGIPVLHGRSFTDADRDGAPEVAIVNETFARRHFAGDAVGKWIQTGEPDPDAPRLTIVGVVADVKYAGLDAEPAPTIYVPYPQHLWWRSMFLVARTRGEPLALAPALRAAVAEVDPQIPVEELYTMDGLLHDSVAAPRFRALLVGAFAGLALLLALTGIYGVLSYTITQQRRETAVRIALGAQPRGIVRLVLGSGMRLALAGIVVGTALAVAVMRLLRGLLFAVSPLDVPTFVLMALLLAGCAVVACALPALRAARADPIQALRAE